MKIFRQVFSPIQVNTYIIKGEGNACIIIDCGCYDRSEENKLKSFLTSHQLTPKLLLNTHCHLDHIFGNGFILREYGLKSRSDARDLYNLREAPEHAALFGLSMQTPPDPAEPLNDGEKILLDEMECEVLFVPGHSSGGVAFYFASEGVVFTGDALFAGSIGRTDLKGGDMETILNSIRTRLFTLPDDTVVYPGHGKETTIGHEKKTNPFFR
jgi:hydroxyacylglutathione hydrolase